MAVSTRPNTATVAEQTVESSATGVEWAAISAGALAAVGVSIILFTLGSGLGIAGANPWSFVPQSVVTFTVGAGIWLVVMQWLSSALGGYLAGRLRKKWVGVRTDEVFFRDTAHGLLAWALATALVAALFTLGSGAVVGSAAAVATDTTVSAEAAEKARQAAASFSILTSLSLVVGAFIGCVAGAIGGFHRDAS
jgi:hypothetical protein